MDCRYLLGLSFCVVFFCNSASAEEFVRLDAKTLDRSIKCELATFIKGLKEADIREIPPSRMVADLILSSQTSKTSSRALNLSLPFAQVGLGSTQGNALLNSFDIKQSYSLNFRKHLNCRNTIKVGILSCFKLNKAFFLAVARSKSGSVKCTKQVMATGSLTASGKLPVRWQLGTVPSYTYNIVRSISIQVSAPPDRKMESKVN